MLDKQLALKLKALVGNPIIWEAFKEHLNNLKTLELQALGGGNIGIGNVPQSGESEFSGTPRATGPTG
jgi:hypothetical protein